MDISCVYSPCVRNTQIRPTMSNWPVFGLTRCTHPRCQLWAYYRGRKQYTGSCRRHANLPLVKLIKDPHQRKAMYDAHTDSICTAQQENQNANRPGTVECVRLVGYRNPPLIPGKQYAFATNFHRGRLDGWSMPSLSPQRIGPIEHGQPGLPLAQNLANFYNGSQWFEGQSLEQFEETRSAMYTDPVPHRYNPCGVTKPGKRRIPCKHFVWVDGECNVQYCTEVEARQFYCTLYEHHVKDLPEFRRLKTAVRDGINIILAGFDARPVTNIDQQYLDPSQPFAHELVLWSMIVLPRDAWPWVKHAVFDFE